MILEKKLNSHPKEQVRRENIPLSQSESRPLLPNSSSVTLPTRKGQREPTPPLLKTSHVPAGTTTSVQPEVSSWSEDLARTLCQRSKINVIYNPITHTAVQSRYYPPTVGCNPPWGVIMGKKEEKRLSGEKEIRGIYMAKWEGESVGGKWHRNKHCWMSFECMTFSLALSCLTLDSMFLSVFSLLLYCCYLFPCPFELFFFATTF